MSQQTILAISLFFHLSATVVWIGGLVITAVLVWPEMRRTLAESSVLANLLNRLRKRFTPLSNLSLGVLILTGLIQMSLDPNYDGVLRFNNAWSQVMLLKHGVIVLMALSGLFLQYTVVPALERTSLLIERGKAEAAAAAAQEWQALRQREVRLTWLNGALGLVVLACSAWAGSL
ncbi:MAG: CopD family protein [bacterium]|nr:CopD family protein [bacterium]